MRLINGNFNWKYKLLSEKIWLFFLFLGLKYEDIKLVGKSVCWVIVVKRFS